MKKISIMEDPKGFFESLSNSQFKDILDEFGFIYEDVSEYSYHIKSVKKYIQNIKINKYTNEIMHFNLNKLMDQKENIIISENYIDIREIDSEKLFSNIESTKKTTKTKEILMENKYDFYHVELGVA